MVRQAVLMAGGKGVRLRPLTYITPKPLTILGDMSILEVILYQLAHYGFGRVIILLGYKPEMVRSVAGDGSKWGIDIKYVQENEPLGTVGGLKLISDDLDENFLVMNTDILTVLNYRRILEYHRLGCHLATIGAIRRLEPIPLGVLEVGANGEVIDYREKPIYHFLAAMGINCFSKAILDYIPAGKSFGLDELIFTLLKANAKIQSFIFSGLWMDLGRPDDLEQAMDLFSRDSKAFLPVKQAEEVIQ